MTDGVQSYCMHCTLTDVVNWNGLMELLLGLVPVMNFMLTCTSVDQLKFSLLPALTLQPQSGATYFLDLP